MFGLFGPKRPPGLVLVRTTVGQRTQAEALAKRLVDDGLAACVHVSELSSVYRWEGKRLQETEYAVEARTSAAAKGRLAAAMLSGHPYEVPLLESWDVADVPPAYAKWAGEQVG